MGTDIMQEQRQGSRKKLSQVGDTPPAEFRKQLHELADWIADFREHIERVRVAPNDRPGAIREQLPKRAPEQGEPFAKILRDVDCIIVPGMVAHVPRRDRTRNSCHRVAAAMGGSAGRIWRRGVRYRIGRCNACARRRA